MDDPGKKISGVLENTTKRMIPKRLYQFIVKQHPIISGTLLTIWTGFWMFLTIVLNGLFILVILLTIVAVIALVALGTGGAVDLSGLGSLSMGGGDNKKEK